MNNKKDFIEKINNIISHMNGVYERNEDTPGKEWERAVEKFNLLTLHKLTTIYLKSSLKNTIQYKVSIENDDVEISVSDLSFTLEAKYLNEKKPHKVLEREIFKFMREMRTQNREILRKEFKDKVKELKRFWEKLEKEDKNDVLIFFKTFPNICKNTQRSI